MNKIKVIFFVICLLLVPACSAGASLLNPIQELEGTILVWHNWSEPESEIIHQLIHDFRELHEEVEIVIEYVPNQELDEQFIDLFTAGLGPDLLIGTDTSIMAKLVEEKLLLDLTSMDINSDQLLPHAVNALRVGDELYGIPFAASTNVLFYNKALVDKPAATLDALLEEARAGRHVALPTDFYHAYWGIRAFGGEVIDFKNGNAKIDAAFVEWLEWLLKAQEENVILSNDYSALSRLFMAGDAAYFVGNSVEVPRFREALGADNLGLALFPRFERPAVATDTDAATEEGDESRPIPLSELLSPGAFLDLEMLSVSKITAQQDISIKLIEFFVNQTHQREIGQLDLGQIPVNRRVRFDPRFSPLQATLIRQSANTVIVPLEIISIRDQLRTVGDDVYTQVLEGVMEPVDAVVHLSKQINSNN